jgi:predicted nucleotidyltransferase/predicted transcriptional regulator
MRGDACRRLRQTTPVEFGVSASVRRVLTDVARTATIVADMATRRASPRVHRDLASLLFGSYRREVLALLLLHPETPLHVREIARATGKIPGTLVRELNQLAEAGVLLRRPLGNQIQFQANAACPIYEELRAILKKTSGLADVLRDALEPLAGKIQAAFVYGSVVRGDERAGSDLDVMIVGDARLAEVVHALAPANEALRREINPNVYRPSEFDAKLAAGEPFLRRVMEERKIYLVGGEDDLRQPASHRKTQGTRRR